jgi:magnesium-transporting ATPase (P-type)
MSVVVKNLKDNTFRCYVKGSPEKMRDLCHPESIPDDFN